MFIKKGLLDEANALQPRIDHLILENQVSAIKRTKDRYQCSSMKWWKTVDQITERASKEVPLFNIFNLDDFNEYFQCINTDCHYESPTTMTITDDTCVPIIDENTTLILSTVKRTAAGPDGTGHWFWRDFALELALAITYLFNLSIKSQVVPLQWKSANITPIPKESPVCRMEQLRPISVTDIIIRLFERIIYTKELKSIVESAISYDQFAYRRGRNTTMALLLCQHMWMKWLDSQADSVRVFAFDFSKAFDHVNHAILFDKRSQLPINPYIYNWIRDFSTGRQQRIAICGNKTSFLPINRGVPQGTIVGPVLFSIMINDIRSRNNSRTLLVKYADDITLSTYRASNYDCAPEEVDSIKKWATENKMSINLTKTKELVARGRSKAPIPTPLPGIEQVDNIKLLGVTFHRSPNNWDSHFDTLLGKAGKRMYILRICKKFGYS